MEEVGKIAIGVLLFAITSVMAYLFRMRQLYATSPKLFRHAPISKDGSICEVLVFNRGNQVEEDIRVVMPPELGCELLASSAAGVSLSGSVISIERLHKLKSVSAMLLVENGLLDTSKMAISSKHTAGRVFKSPDSVPPNYAFVFLSLLIVVIFFAAMYKLPAVLDEGREAFASFKLSKHINEGWGDLGRYWTSDLRESYSDQEFPLRLEKHQIAGAILRAHFDIYNKTALPIKVYADRVGKAANSASAYDIENFSSVEVPPLSAGKLIVTVPYAGDTASKARFSIHMGDRFQAVVTYTFNLSR